MFTPIVSTYTVKFVGKVTGPGTMHWDEPMSQGQLLATVQHWESSGVEITRVVRDCDGAVMIEVG